MNDTPRSSSIASDLNTMSTRSQFMYPSPQPMHHQFNQPQFNHQFSQPPPTHKQMDPRLRNMSSSVFDLNQANMMRQPMMTQPQWINNNMQQAQSMAQLNRLPGHGYPRQNAWMDGSLNGSNMSLNMPGYPQMQQPQQPQQQWMNQWPGVYPYPVGMVPMVPAGKTKAETFT